MPQESQVSSQGHAPFPWPQLVILLVGTLYLLLGMIGFWVAGLDPSTFFAHTTERTVMGLELNGVQNAIHLVLGVAGLACASKLRWSRAYGMALFIVCGVWSIFGVFAISTPSINIFSLNWPGNILHLVTALGGLAAALGRARSDHPYRDLQETAERVGRQMMGMPNERGR